MSRNNYRRVRSNRNPSSVRRQGRPSVSAARKPGIPGILKLALVVIIIALAAFCATKALDALSAASQGVDAHADDALASTGIDGDLTDSASPRSITVSFAGDCTLGTDENFDQSRSFNAMYDDVGDPSYFLANVAPYFKSDDLTFVNMEGTLTTSTTRVDKQFAFKGPPEYAGILSAGSVEVASFTNNHSEDYGPKSHTDTIEALEGEGILVCDEDKIAYTTVNDIKVACIGVYELDYHREREADVRQFIATAKENGAELILIYFHWGNEREYSPDENEIYMGHLAIDCGADFVFGSHPHVMQGYEKYNGRYIFYSMGNFCYGGHSNPNDKDCMLVQKTFTLDGSEVRLDDEVTVVPCSISSVSSRNNYQPTPAEGEELERISAKIEELNQNVQDALAAYRG